MIGDLYRTRAGWAVRAPAACLNGHRLDGGQVLVGYQPCDCRGGHTTWECRCCDTVAYWPPVGRGCRVLAGPAAVR